MGTDLKLKDLFGQTQTEQDISTVSVPKADGTGREFYVKRPVIYYRLVASPPYAPQEGDSIIIYWNLGDGGLDHADIGNSLGRYHEAVDGKTTKPIVRVTASKYLEGISADNSGYADLVYLEEAVPGQTLIDILFGGTGTADFTAQPGWGQLIQGTDGQTYTYTQLTDLSGIAIGIEQPNNILNQRLFFSYLTEKTNSNVAYTAAKNGAHTIVPPAESSGISAVNLTVDVPEPNLQEKSVEIAENGIQEFSPDTGYDGIKKLTATVNVAGGGGAGVQPDYAQNNTTAADYIKNRPGGYMVETPSISKTMTAADYRSDDHMDGVYKFSDVDLPDEAIVGGTGKVTTVGSDGAATEHDISSIVFNGENFGLRFYLASIAGSTDPLTIISGSAPDGSNGTYFQATLQDTTVTAYISQFTTAAYSKIVEIPEKFTEVKPADWGASYGEDGYVAGRVGGYFLTETDFVKLLSGSYKYSWDGVIGDKETVDARINQPGEPLSFRYVKVSDETFAALLSVGAHITSINTSNGKPAELAATRENLSIGMLGTISIDEVNKENPFRIPLVVISYSNHALAEMGGTEVSFTQGIWFAQNLNNDGTAKGYVSELALSGGSYPLMPYELVEQNSSTLTTDDQTLTDAQKLQARTNIGTVEGTNKEMFLSSSTAGSTKRFKITVTDDGTLTATEVTQ